MRRLIEGWCSDSSVSYHIIHIICPNWLHRAIELGELTVHNVIYASFINPMHVT